MIKIELNLGQVALKISADVKKESEQKVYALGMASEAYRASASKVFGPKGFARDAQYSPELDLAMRNALGKVLGEHFENVEIESSAKPAGKAKITVESVLASLSEADLEAALAARKNGAEKVEAPVEPKTADIG